MISHRALILFLILATSMTCQTAQEKNEKLFCHTLRQDATTPETA